MTSTIYIDTLADYVYDFTLAADCRQVLKMQESINGTVEFICNSAGNISHGDVYQIRFDRVQDSGDLLLFTLKHPNLAIVDSLKVEQYIFKHASARKYTKGDLNEQQNTQNSEWTTSVN